MIGLMAHQSLEVDFFPGILEGLVGRLGLAPPGVTNPPTSIREGVARHWAAALREAVEKTEGRDVDPGQIAGNVAPHGLHLNYDLDFRSRRVGDIAPTLTSPLLPDIIGNILQPEWTPPPSQPPSFQARKDQGSSSERPSKQETSTQIKIKCPFCKKSPDQKETLQDESPSQKELPFEADQEEASVVSISDEDMADQEPPGTSTSRSAQIPDRK